MNSEAFDRYRGLLTELLFEREAAGGELSEEDESRYVERLDELWWQLSSSDQDRIEQELRRVAVEVEEEPDLTDVAVAEGSSGLPRKKVA